MRKLIKYFAAEPITEENTYISEIEYSPLVGGFAAVLNDGRAAFLTAFSLQFDPNVSTSNNYL
jgi:RAB6A-GEF complex partner protein 1